MYSPTSIGKLSAEQIRKLLGGHRVRVKAGNAHVLHLSNEQHKKVHSAHKKGCGTTLQFDPFQQQMEVHHKLRHGHGGRDQLVESSSFHKNHGRGEGVSSRGRIARRGRGAFDVFKSVVKAVAPIAIDEGGKFIKSKVDGWGAKSRKHKKGGSVEDDLRTALNIAEEVAPIALPLLMGLGEGKSGCHQRGGALMPAGY